MKSAKNRLSWHQKKAFPNQLFDETPTKGISPGRMKAKPKSAPLASSLFLSMLILLLRHYDDKTGANYLTLK